MSLEILECNSSRIRFNVGSNSNIWRVYLYINDVEYGFWTNPQNREITANFTSSQLIDGLNNVKLKVVNSDQNEITDLTLIQYFIKNLDENSNLSVLIDENITIKNDLVTLRNTLADNLDLKGIEVYEYTVSDLYYDSSTWTVYGKLNYRTMPFEFKNPSEAPAPVHIEVVNKSSNAFIRNILVYPSNSTTISLSDNEKIERICFRNGSGWNGESSIYLIKQLFKSSSHKMSSLIDEVGNIITNPYFTPEWSNYICNRIADTTYSINYLADILASNSVGNKIYCKGANSGYSHRVLEYDVDINVYNEIVSLSDVYGLIWYNDTTVFATNGNRGILVKIDLTTKTYKNYTSSNPTWTHVSTLIGDKIYTQISSGSYNGLYEFNIITETWNKISSASHSAHRLFNANNELYSLYYTSSNAIFKLSKYNFATNLFEEIYSFSTTAKLSNTARGFYLNSKANKIYFWNDNFIYEVDFTTSSLNKVVENLPTTQNDASRVIFEPNNKVMYAIGNSPVSFMFNLKGVDF